MCICDYYYLLLYGHQNRHQMSFLLHGKYNYIFFVYHINSKKYRYSTNIKINRIDWDTKTQRPKKKKAFNKITDTLNEYQRAYNMLKEEYGQILTNKIARIKPIIVSLIGKFL